MAVRLRESVGIVSTPLLKGARAGVRQRAARPNWLLQGSACLSLMERTDVASLARGLLCAIVLNGEAQAIFTETGIAVHYNLNPP
jgi:hypothetical protein